MPTYIDTIICEDVRQELGNKVTLAGVFGDEVVVAQIPVAIASLAVLQRWHLSNEEVDRGVGQFTFGIEAPDHQLQKFPAMPQAAPVKGVYTTSVSFVLKFVNFPVRMKGEFKFKTYLNDVEMKEYKFYVLTPADMQAAQSRGIGFTAVQ